MACLPSWASATTRKPGIVSANCRMEFLTAGSATAIIPVVSARFRFIYIWISGEGQALKCHYKNDVAVGTTLTCNLQGLGSLTLKSPRLPTCHLRQPESATCTAQPLHRTVKVSSKSLRRKLMLKGSAMRAKKVTSIGMFAKGGYPPASEEHPLARRARVRTGCLWLFVPLKPPPPLCWFFETLPSAFQASSSPVMTENRKSFHMPEERL